MIRCLYLSSKSTPSLKSSFTRKSILSFVFCLIAAVTLAQTGMPDTVNRTDTANRKAKPDTVQVGIYITSIHDIDFKQKEFSVNFWIWLKYRNRAFDFYQNLEIPGAKTVSKSFMTIDTSGGKVYMQMKLQCTMKDSWRINNFPFDQQRLRLSIENSQFDSRYLVFAADTVGNHYDPRFTVSGWIIDSCVIYTGIKQYETAFGEEGLLRPHTDYSAFRVRVVINRDASGLFWKMFLGMYIAFLIAYVCFFIHADGIDSRFGLSVGSLFAVVGNKYIIDSSLPESTSFTLVDTLHGITLFAIFIVIAANAYSLQLVKKNLHAKARRFDLFFGQSLLAVYIILNVYFIVRAAA
jgi:hypothetical protein